MISVWTYTNVSVSLPYGVCPGGGAVGIVVVAEVATGGVGGIFLLREEHGDAATVGGDVVIVVVAGTYPILVCGGVKGCGARDDFVYGGELFIGEQVAQGGAHVVIMGSVVIRVGVDIVGVGGGEVGVCSEIYVHQCRAHCLCKGIHFARLNCRDDDAKVVVCLCQLIGGDILVIGLGNVCGVDGEETVL